MPEPRDHAQRLDALMDSRRLERGLRWKDVASSAGITHQTLLQLRRGENVSTLTIASAERALEWAPGSIQRVLDGGDPQPLPPEGGYPVIEGRRMVDGQMRTIRTNAITDQLKNLSPEEQDELIDYLAQITELELQRKRKEKEGEG